MFANLIPTLSSLGKFGVGKKGSKIGKLMGQFGEGAEEAGDEELGFLNPDAQWPELRQSTDDTGNNALKTMEFRYGRDDQGPGIEPIPNDTGDDRGFQLLSSGVLGNLSNPRGLDEQFPKTYVADAIKDVNDRILSGTAQLPEGGPTKKGILENYDIFNKDDARKRLYEMMDAPAPKKEDFKLTIGDRLRGLSTGWEDGAMKGQDALYGKYNTAVSERDKRIKQLADLAGIDEKAIGLKLRGLEAENKMTTDQWEHEDKAADRALREKEFTARGWTVYDNDITGRRTAYNPVTQESRDLGKIDRTLDEKDAATEAEEKRKAAIESGHIAQRGKSALDVANARGEWALKSVEKKVAGAIQTAQAKAAATPDAKAKAAWNAVVALGMQGVPINDYINFKGEIPVVEYQSYFGAPDAEDLATMEKIKQAFARAMAGGEAAPTATPTATPTAKKDPLGIR